MMMIDGILITFGVEFCDERKQSHSRKTIPAWWLSSSAHCRVTHLGAVIDQIRVVLRVQSDLLWLDCVATWDSEVTVIDRHEPKRDYSSKRYKRAETSDNNRKVVGLNAVIMLPSVNYYQSRWRTGLHIIFQHLCFRLAQKHLNNGAHGAHVWPHFKQTPPVACHDGLKNPSRGVYVWKSICSKRSGACEWGERNLFTVIFLQHSYTERCSSQTEENTSWPAHSRDTGIAIWSNIKTTIQGRIYTE